MLMYHYIRGFRMGSPACRMLKLGDFSLASSGLKSPPRTIFRGKARAAARELQRCLGENLSHSGLPYGKMIAAGETDHATPKVEVPNVGGLAPTLHKM